MNKFIFISIIFLLSLQTYAQNITAKIVDSTSKKPIAYAAIQLNKKTGTISNDEGVFTLNLDTINTASLTISCLGYGTKTLSLEAIKANNYIIFLKESANILDEVYLSNKKPNADSIIAKVNSNLKNNYKHLNLKHSLFYRETNYVDFNAIDLQIKKATHVKKAQLNGANSNLDSLARVIKKNKTLHFIDFMGDYYAKDESNTKLKVEKATQLIDNNNAFSIEGIQKKAQNIILKYLDKSKTYNLKSGLFKIEDSLSLEKDLKSENNNEFEINHLKSKTKGLLKDSQFVSGSALKDILNTAYFNYNFKDFTYYDGEMVYIIEFSPRKSKSKFSGTLYITDESYAVIRADYAYSEGKRGRKVNLKLLLGLKYVENLRKGTIIYKKDDENIYHPNYIKEESGSYFYVSRPVKFIENSKSKYKVLFDFILEGNMRNKEELLLIDITRLDIAAYDNIFEESKIPIQLLKAYDPSIWKNKKTIEPLQEMKQFKSIE